MGLHPFYRNLSIHTQKGVVGEAPTEIYGREGGKNQRGFPSTDPNNEATLDKNPILRFDVTELNIQKGRERD